jgi:phosphoribosyl-ATP pyrophosphohydrolase/phosphoribosyl-AMP cyclohydrolase
MIDLDALDFARGGGFVTVVAQDADSGAVLMVARADRDALARTIETGEMHYHSRTRGLWHKGATSGNVQRVVALTPDCDGDTVLARVRPAGPACHTGDVSCFAGATEYAHTVARLSATINQRARLTSASGSYTARLLADRNLRLKKLGEEAAELAVACADEDRERAIEESADLLYHVLVALAAQGAGWHDVATALVKRESPA